MTAPEYASRHELQLVKQRLAEIDQSHREISGDVREIKELLSQGVPEMIGLFHDVKSSMRMFVRVGNALKWLVGLGASLAGSYYAVKHFFTGY